MQKRWRHLANEFDEADGRDPSAEWPAWKSLCVFSLGLVFFLFGVGTCTCGC